MSDHLSYTSSKVLYYQQLLERQLTECLKVLQDGNIKTVTEYLNKCYENGFIGNMYSLNQQNIPLVLPMNQNQVVQAVMKPTESFTFSQRLEYKENYMKKEI